MTDDALTRYVRFIKEAEGLKSVTRTSWTATGRQESTAEHSWRLCLLASLLSHDMPDLDREKVLRMCLIHDLGELYSGDVSAAACPDQQAKYAEERAAAEAVFAFLPKPAAQEFFALWEEYNAAATPEARFVKALDKAETILQHNQGTNPADFDYAFNLAYGKEYFSGAPCLEPLRAILDSDTRDRMAKTP